MCTATHLSSTIFSIVYVRLPPKQLLSKQPAAREVINLFDPAIGHDNLFHGDRYKFSTRLEIINLTNNNVLYNFLSTFSGTHYVTPRTFTGTVAFHF